MLGKQIKDFAHAPVVHLLKVDEARDFRLTPEVIRHRVRADLNERAFAFQEHVLVRAVVDDNIWVSLRDHHVVLAFIAPDVKLSHFNGFFFNTRFHAVVAVEVEVDVTHHSWV